MLVLSGRDFPAKDFASMHRSDRGWSRMPGLTDARLVELADVDRTLNRRADQLALEEACIALVNSIDHGA